MSIASDPKAGPLRAAPLADPATATGRVFIISGPSGVGKDSVKKGLKAADFPLGYCVTATTRGRKQNEEHGVDYEFLSDAEFEALLAADELLEHAIVHGKHYGIPRRNLRAGLRLGHDVLVTPDVQGAATLRANLQDVITIFLTPTRTERDAATPEPDPHLLQELGKRLAGRDRETPAERELRLATAVREMQRLSEYDYVVVNEQGRLDETVERIKAIICAERCRVKPRVVTL